MLPRKKLSLAGRSLLASGLLWAPSVLPGQTVTVSNTIPADFTTIQAAIDALAPGGGMDDSNTANNVVQILDDSIYQEALTINGMGITIESTGLNRPRLIANATEASVNTNNFQIRFDSDDLCVLRGLIIMPATESQPDGCITFDDFSNTNGFAYDVIMEDVVISANNGSDQPVSEDGKTAPDGTELRYGDNVLDFNSTPTGATPTVTLTRTVVTAASTGFGDNIRFFVDNAAITFEEDCVSSYSEDHGIYFSAAENSVAEYIGTQANPIIIHGNEGGGIFSNSPTCRVASNLEYVAITRNSDDDVDTAVLCLYTGPEANTWTNVTLAGNYVEEGLFPTDGAIDVQSPLELENCILGGDGSEYTVSSRNLINMNNEMMTVDGVCIDTSHGPTSLNVMYQREVSEDEDGILNGNPAPIGVGYTNLSPDFISLDPSSSDYLRVTNVEFEYLGPGETELVGAGYFSPLPFTGILDDSGNFQSFIEAINIPSSSSSDKYSQPNADEMLIFSSVAHNILEGELQAASNLAALIDYDVIHYEDTVSTSTWYTAVQETSGGAGGWRGFFWFDPSPGRQVVMESPHPLFDGTRLEAIDVAIDTDSIAFMQSGTHRQNSPLDTPCDGTFGGNPYRISDMAHTTQSYFQMAHKMIHNYHEESLLVSVHGMADSSDPSDVVISNGTGDEIVGTSLSKDIADYMNVLLNADPRYAVSHQEPGESPALSGSTNTQGRYTNGSADPCEISANALSPERFIHMEQDPDVRNTPSSNWDFITQTYNDLIPLFPAQTVVAKEDGSLVSEYLLDGNTDSETGQRSGTINGSVTPGPNRFTAAAEALQFEDSGYVSIKDYPYDGTDTEFTLSFWFRANSTGGGNFQYMFSHGSIGRGGEVTMPDSLHVYLERDTGQIRVRYTVSDGTPWVYNGTSNWNDDDWHFFTMTYSQTAGATVYVDSVSEGSDTGVALNTFDPEGSIILGGRSDLASNRFLAENPSETGYIDNFRIHNTALDQTAIDNLFNDLEGGSNVEGWNVF